MRSYFQTVTRLLASMYLASTQFIEATLTVLLWTQLSKYNSCKTLIGVHEMHSLMHPNQVLQLFCWTMTPLIIGLPYDHPHPSPSRLFTYKNLHC